MIGAATGQRRAVIALDVGDEPVHLKNPYLPNTCSEMALPLIVGDDLLGAVTIQSEEEDAFSDEDVTSLQAMADHLAVAINNARLLKALDAAHAELVRTKTFEAIAGATLEAIHWIGNRALPISASVKRLQEDLEHLPPTDPERLASMCEDLGLVENSARLIVSVQEHLIGPAREEKPRPAMVQDVVKDAVVETIVPASIVSYDIAPNLPLVRADTTQLRRAFGYVLRNALEAMGALPDKHISVEVVPLEGGGLDSPDCVAVRIGDIGPGVPEEELDRIWAAFYTTKGVSHAGLGLSACLQILRQIDGQISVANGPAGGAVFEMRIPVFGDLPSADLPGGKSVLLIDDDDAWSRFAKAALRDAGNTVARSADGCVDLDGFDCILMDEMLETSDGSAVLQRLVGDGTGGKTLVVASSLRVERSMAWIQTGARDVVLKPYTPATLAEVVGY